MVPRYADRLELWLVSGSGGWRAFPAREVAEANLGVGDRLYRGPGTLGELLEACRLESLEEVERYIGSDGEGGEE